MKIKGIQTEKGKLGEKERLVQDVVMGEQKMSSDSDRVTEVVKKVRD